MTDKDLTEVTAKQLEEFRYDALYGRNPAKADRRILSLVAEVRRLREGLRTADGLLRALVISSGTDYLQPAYQRDDSYNVEVTVTVGMLNRVREWLTHHEEQEFVVDLTENEENP